MLQLYFYRTVNQSHRISILVWICSHRFESVATDCNPFPQIRLCGYRLQSVPTDSNMFAQIRICGHRFKIFLFFRCPFKSSILCSATQPHTCNYIVWCKPCRPKRCHLHHTWHSDLQQPHLVSCKHLSTIVGSLSRRSANYCLLRPYPVCRTHYVWLEYCWLLMMPVSWQLQSCIIDALSCARPVIYSDTNLHKIPMSSSITVDGNWPNLWKTSVISSHTLHLLSLVAEGRHNIKSRDWWRRECPCLSELQWRRTVHGQESISSA